LTQGFQHFSTPEGDHHPGESDYESNYESAEGEPQVTERNYSASEDEYELLQLQSEQQEAPPKRGPRRPKVAKNKVRAPPNAGTTASTDFWKLMDSQDPTAIPVSIIRKENMD
jgi:hypothetical protein